MTKPAPVALITGAARRLGAAMAERLAAEGFQLALHYNHSDQAARDLAERIVATGAVCQLFRGDLAVPAEVAGIWQAVIERFGAVDLLVNNASSFHEDDLLALQGMAMADHLAVNMAAALQVTAAMATQNPLPPAALVVNMLDNRLLAPNPDHFSYTLSKAALMMATRTGAMRLQGRPRICGIAPSITLASGPQSAAEFEASARINPMRRRVTPGDICDTLMLLWSEPRLDGEILVLDGGQMLLGLPRDVAYLTQAEAQTWQSS